MAKSAAKKAANSTPNKTTASKAVAVEVIDPRGNEVMQVHPLA